MHAYARAEGEISKELFYRKSARGPHWEKNAQTPSRALSMGQNWSVRSTLVILPEKDQFGQERVSVRQK